MYNKKSIIVICLFLSISGWVAFISLKAGSSSVNNEEFQAADSVEKSHFVNVHYFQSEGNAPSFELKSNDLVIINQSKLDFQNPNGMFFMKDGREVRYVALKGNLQQEIEELTLEGNVLFEDNQNKYYSDFLNYYGKRDLLNTRGHVKTLLLDEKTSDEIQITSDRLSSFISSKIVTMDGDVKGVILRRRKYEGQMNFAADNVVVNSPESRINLTKNVKIKRNSYNLSAGSAEIFLENFNKKLKYYVLYDDVKLEEKVELHSGGTQLRRAYAEKLEAHQATGRVVLTGAPRVEQGEDIIKGYQITLRENVELVEVDDSKSSFSLKKDKNE